MSQALLKIAKLIPRLGGASVDNERLAALAIIERTLQSEGLNFVDAGLKLQEFVTNVLKVKELPPAEPSKPKYSGFQSAAPQPFGGAKPKPQPQPQPSSRARGQTHQGPFAHSAGSGFQQQTRPQSPPPPPPGPKWSQVFASELAKARSGTIGPHTITILNKMVADRLDVLLSPANKHSWTYKENDFLNNIYFIATGGMRNVTQLSIKQLEYFYALSDRVN